MSVILTENQKSKKLVKVSTMPMLAEKPEITTLVKNRHKIRHVSDPCIRKHKNQGHIYYCYHWGISPEVYLGTADHILKCVRFYKEKLKE